ncbi:MAG: hypothetical protein Phog2KO_27090 [Phototrophicaceae bacterium]
MTSYEEKLEQEAELWGSEAEHMAQKLPPNWQAHQELRHNRILHGEHINKLLNTIESGMTVVELGCGAGWFTLAMAQQGADALGLDISEKSLTVARDYYESIQDSVSGTATYAYADLNNLDLAPNSYDVIVVKATLHHLVNMRHVIENIHQALKPNGLFWISDTLHDEAFSSVLMASAITFVMPTEVSYSEKFRGLAKFGLNAPERIKMSMEAEGLSPFEGAGRDHNWLEIMEEYFTIEQLTVHPAITGYVTAQLRLPDILAMPFLKTLKVIDKGLVSLGILQSSARVVYARKV